MKKIDKTEYYTSFGAYIREARIQKGITQIELCEKCNIPQSYYSRIESGKHEKIPFDVALSLCLAVGASINDFVERYI